MANIYRQIFAYIVLLVFVLNMGVSQIVYEGKSYDGETYSGKNLTPVIYGGKAYQPISYSGTFIEGKCYEGLCLTNVKISEIKLTGDENARDFFQDSIAENFDINWKKVISQFVVGTSIITLTGIAWFITGKVAPLFIAVPKNMFKNEIKDAFMFAATEAMIRGTLAVMQGKPKEGVFKTSLEGFASGFMQGAIFGAITGALKGVSAVLPKVSAELARILKLGALILTDGEKASLLKNPGTLAGMITKYTGKSAKDGFLEFFIRLSMSDPAFVEKLSKLPKICEKVSSYIRGGKQSHEWLEASKFFDYLLNKKWGGDGFKAAVTLVQFIQKTERVIQKSGVSHLEGGYDTWHRELTRIIEGCESYSELMNSIYKYAKKTLRPDSFEEFKVIFYSL